MGLWEEMAKDSVKVVAEVGRPVVIAGKTYTAIVGQPVNAEVLMEGGFQQQISIEIKMLRSDLDGKIPTLLSFNGKALRVENFSDQPPNPYVVLACKHENQ